MRRAVAAASLAGLLLAACTKPVQVPPRQFTAPTPEIWSGAAVAAAEAEADWWAYLQDDGLDAAIRKALACSQTVRAAAARIEAARQERRIAGAAELPDLSVGVNRLRQRQNFVGLPFPGLADRVLSSTFTSAGLSFNIAWEADFWNRVGARKLAADATLDERVADREAARLSLSGQVAKAWFAAIEAQRQIGLAEGILAHTQVVAERNRERYRAGMRSPLDVRLAEGDIERARATVKQREQLRNAFVRQLETLACEYPAGERTPAASLPALPTHVPAGLPSELVHRRPDLVAAERALLAAGARTVEAKAALRPSFALTTGSGTSSNALLDLVNPSVQVWNYALNVTQPLFNRGRLKATVRANEARADEAAADYESRIWTAYLEIETALSAEQTLREQESALRAAFDTTEEAIGLAELRYGAGMLDVFTVLSLRRTALETESALLGLHRTRIDNRVDLHLALGGGFAPEPGGAAGAGATP